MKAKRRTIVLRVQYWACAIPEHRHQTESVATTCIARWKEKPKKKTSNFWNDASYNILLAQFRSGVTPLNLAKQYNVTRGRIYQLLKKAEYRERRDERIEHAACLAGERPIGDLALTQRSMNCLKSGGISYIGDLVQYSRIELLKLPLMGRKMVDQIREELARVGLHLRGDDTASG